MEPGTRVRIQGLVRASHHNGKVGSVTRTSAPEGRVGVRLEDGTVVAVRVDNLEDLDLLAGSTHLCDLLGHRNPHRRDDGGDEGPHADVDWNVVAARALAHPDEARCPFFSAEAVWEGFHEEYQALHYLIARHRDPPLEAVRAVAEADRGATNVESGDGTPLSIACWTGQGGDIIRYLRDLRIADIRGGRCEKRLFDSCWWGFIGHRPEVAKLLLEEYPEGVLDDREDEEEEDSSYSYEREIPMLKIIENFDRGSNGWYETLKLFLLVLEHGTVKEDALIEQVKESHPLLTLCSFFMDEASEHDLDRLKTGMVNIFEEFLAREPSQFRSRDDSGRLPLALFVCEKQEAYRDDHVGLFPALFDILLRGYPEAIDVPCGLERAPPLWHAIQNNWPIDLFVEASDVPIRVLQVRAPDDRRRSEAQQTRVLETAMETIIKKDPTSLSTPIAHGRFAIHFAIENRWPTAPILEAYPDQIRVRDQRTALYPFQFAAVQRGDWHAGVRYVFCRQDFDICVVNLVYDLLRRDPSLVQS